MGVTLWHRAKRNDNCCLWPALPPPRDAKETSKWLSSLRPGAAADFKFDGGWWEVELLRLEKPKDGKAGGGSPKWRARSVQYEVEHEVPLDLLRPPYVWDAGKGSSAPEWRERPPPEVCQIVMEPCMT